MSELFDSNMSIKDVFTITMQIEKTSEHLYRQMAGQLQNKEHRQIFESLAEEEGKHARIIEDRMRNLASLIGSASVPAHLAQLARYLKDEIFDKEIISRKVINIHNVSDIYEFGISFELDQVLFYNEIKDAVRAEHRGFIDELIADERRHFLRLLKLKQIHQV